MFILKNSHVQTHIYKEGWRKQNSKAECKIWAYSSMSRELSVVFKPQLTPSTAYTLWCAHCSSEHQGWSWPYCNSTGFKAWTNSMLLWDSVNVRHNSLWKQSEDKFMETEPRSVVVDDDDVVCLIYFFLFMPCCLSWTEKPEIMVSEVCDSLVLHVTWCSEEINNWGHNVLWYKWRAEGSSWWHQVPFTKDTLLEAEGTQGTRGMRGGSSRMWEASNHLGVSKCLHLWQTPVKGERTK